MRANHSGEIQPVGLPPSTPAQPAPPVPDAPERSASLKGPEGLASRGKSGSAAVYTTANMAQRSDRTVLSKLKSLWKGGKTTANASLGPLAVGTQTRTRWCGTTRCRRHGSRRTDGCRCPTPPRPGWRRP